MPAASKLGCPGGAHQQFHDLGVVRDWNFKHLFTGAQVRWAQRGGGGELPPAPVPGVGEMPSPEGLKCLGAASQGPSAAVPKPFWNLLSCVIPLSTLG